MKAPVSWIREFAAVPFDPRQVGSRLAACGFEVASIEADVIDFEITANRPDCLSVYGLAREAATAFNLELKPAPGLEAAAAPAASGGRASALVPVSLGDAGCGRYALAVVEVRVGPSPAWLIDRLTAAGVRPINNVVDVTNYVMLEVGHPMHAFDVAKLGGPEIRVRRARGGESLVTLDNQSRTLDETMLVIADHDRAIALAGVMGGAATEVSDGTTRIALESAWFLPASVRATSRKLGLKTEASARFERGADITAPVRALHRALALFEQIGAGRPAGGVVDVYPRPAEPRHLALRRGRIAQLLGDTVPDRDVERILTHLGFTLRAGADAWDVQVPLFRVDVQREADLIEEVGRHWGFDRIPASFPALRSRPRPVSRAVVRDRRLRAILCGAGWQETATFTFMEEDAATPFLPAGEAAVAIANPLSEKFAVLRPSLLPGLLDALVYNRRREADDVRLFEIGAIFRSSGESSRVGWISTGARFDHWSGRGGAVDFFDAKGAADLVGQACNVALTAVPALDLPWFVPGRTANLTCHTADGVADVGTVGQIQPELVARRGLTQPDAVYGGELVLAALERVAGPASWRITPLPRHPSIVRDLSILVDERLPAAEVRGTIRANAPKTLVSVREFDRYHGPGVPAGQLSLSVRLTFRDPDRTLTDSEVQQSVDAIVAALTAEVGATLRSK
jgi:phenylalanyl-tRNA synthetase beta chain